MNLIDSKNNIFVGYQFYHPNRLLVNLTISICYYSILSNMNFFMGMALQLHCDIEFSLWSSLNN